MSINYDVKIEEFAKKNIKIFKRKYKNNWHFTEKSIISLFERIETFLKTDKIDNIKESNELILVKMDFKIAGSDQSPKSSGNRCIAIVDKKERVVYILYLYHKNFLKKGNETIQWKNIIKENYLKYCNFIN